MIRAVWLCLAMMAVLFGGEVKGYEMENESLPVEGEHLWMEKSRSERDREIKNWKALKERRQKDYERQRSPGQSLFAPGHFVVFPPGYWD